MKTILAILTLFSATTIQTDTIPTPEEMADKMCNCGTELTQILPKLEAAQTDEEKYNLTRQAGLQMQQMMGCIGGNELITKIEKTMSAEERRAYEEKVFSHLETKCPQTLKVMRAVR